MAIYSIQVPLGGLADVLSVTPNVGYLAVFKQDDNSLAASHFPYWVIVDYQGQRFSIPVISKAFNNPGFIFTHYVGYYPESQLPVGIPIIVDKFFSPFMDAETLSNPLLN